MALPPLKSIKSNDRINFRTSLQALQYIPRFFKEIHSVDPNLFNINALCRLIASATPLAMMWVGKLIIDEIVLISTTKATDYTQLWWYVGFELGIVVLGDLLNRGVTLSDSLLGDLYSNASSIKIINKTNDLTISQLEDSELYDKLERARTQTSSRVGLMSNALGQVQSLLTIISLIGGLIYFEPWLIVLLVLSIIPSFINEIKFSSSRYSIARSWTAERRELDYLRYIGANDKTAKEIKLFGLTDFVANRFGHLAHKYYLVNRSLSIRRSMWGSSFNILGVLSYYGAYVFIIFRVITGVITLGDLTFLSGSFQRLKTTLQSTFSQFTRISESALYLRDYFDFIDLKITEKTSDFSPLPDKIQTGFEFRDVHFNYPGVSEKVLAGVNFTLQAGEKLAFVGVNGAGKTTLIKLLLRFYEPTQGEILLDGVNINQFEKEAFQQFFGVIFQDFVKYEFTIKENIGIGNIKEIENQPKIEAAAEQSLASEVVNELANGYDQQLGKRFSRGKDLSGGQWQKVALARAYMKDAKVMILDEPTSALDARAEYEAFQRFIGLTEGKTSVIISHRFSTVRMADRIMVLKAGKILEIGTHEELMKTPQLYAELFTLQAAGYQ
ncbi:MAG: ATP-binding cassette subfamily B protein [Spirosomataceae bacterium]|jgi:ATP-binding cassette subfamily B protein